MVVFNRLFWLWAIFCLMLINPAQAQDHVGEDSVQAEGLHERLFSTVDEVLDWMSTDSWSFIPAVTYSPETSLGLGVAAIKVFRSEKSQPQNLRPSSMPVSFIYTLNKQAILEADLDLWKNYNKDYISASLELAKYPFKFYGIGNDMPSSQEEGYASRYFYLKFSYFRKLVPHLYAGPWAEFRLENVYETSEGGMLAGGTVPGSAKSRVSGLGLRVNYDSRDDIFQPQSGSYHQLSWITYQNAFGSEFAFNRYEIDLRKYFSIWNNKVLAVQGYWSFIGGTAPFQQLSLLGGSRRMRGFLEGRYRDNLAMVYQTEFRLPVYKNLGMVFFGSTGQAADQFDQYDFDRFHYGGGFGFRYKLLDEGINIRIDFGFGDQSAFYFGLNEVI